MQFTKPPCCLNCVKAYHEYERCKVKAITTRRTYDERRIAKIDRRHFSYWANLANWAYNAYEDTGEMRYKRLRRIMKQLLLMWWRGVLTQEQFLNTVKRIITSKGIKT